LKRHIWALQAADAELERQSADHFNALEVMRVAQGAAWALAPPRRCADPYISICVRTYVCVCLGEPEVNPCLCVYYISVCIFIYIYVYMYIHIYVYIYTIIIFSHVYICMYVYTCIHI